MSRRKCIALIAHDEKKDDMAAFAAENEAFLAEARIVATGTTGGRVLEACPGLDVTRLKSGPLGGDQQIGALIATIEDGVAAAGLKYPTQGRLTAQADRRRALGRALVRCGALL